MSGRAVQIVGNSLRSVHLTTVLSVASRLCLRKVEPFVGAHYKSGTWFGALKFVFWSRAHSAHDFVPVFQAKWFFTCWASPLTGVSDVSRSIGHDRNTQSDQ
jgi:hypothetical protein